MKGLAIVGLVEDDAMSAELYSAMLESAGFRVVVWGSAEEFRRRSGAESIDILLLDWTLPKASGIDLLKYLRAQPALCLPIVLLTAKSDESDIVLGLQSGADDYIIKPPRQAEFVARVRAALRRTHSGVVQVLPGTEPFGFDLGRRELQLNGVPKQVTDREFDLLVYLFRRTERIVSRQMLLADVWGLPASANTRSIDTFVSRLRKTLGLNGESGWYLEGVYQHGYRLTRRTG